MISTDSTPPDQQPYDEALEADPHETLVLAQVRARRLSALSTLVVALAVALAVTAVLVIAVRSSSQSADNGDRVDALAKVVADQSTLISNLTDQAKLLRGQLTAKDDVDAAHQQCANKLAAGVRDTTRDYLADLGDLVIALRPLATGTGTGDAGIDGAVADIGKSLDAYRAATKASSDWNVLPSDQQIPCPV